MKERDGKKRRRKMWVEGNGKNKVKEENGERNGKKMGWMGVVVGVREIIGEIRKKNKKIGKVKKRKWK